MNPFDFLFHERNKIMQVMIHPSFQVEHWPEFEQFHRAQIEQGVVNWDINLREINWINSRFLGLLIGFNAILMYRGGSLKLTLRKNTKFAEIVHQSRLDKIIAAREV